MSAKEKRKIRKQLDALKAFANTKAVRQLRKELQQKLVRLRPRKGRQARLTVSRKEVQRQANLARASKVHKYHNYLKQIQNNFPDLTYSQIRKAFKERKQGKQVDIPDVVWRNPSP